MIVFTVDHRLLHGQVAPFPDAARWRSTVFNCQRQRT